MDIMDETRLAIRHYAARPGDFCMPDQLAPGPSTRGANWLTAFTMREAIALDRACSEGARNGATFPGVARVDRGAGDDDYPRRMPTSEAEARSMRDEADARVARAEARDPGNRAAAWARETARRGAADRERQQATRREAEQRVAETDARDFEHRVAAEVERRLRELEV
jgi:hypothetical protein